MLSRALSLATVMILVGCFAAIPVQAQNLEAGKSPSQIFAGTCSLCHKSSRGLLKTVPPGSLPGFLREHYTTSSDMASLLSAYLISNGANDTRYVGSQPKQGKDAKPEVNPVGLSEQFDRQGRRQQRPVASPQEAARPDVASPDTDGLSPQAERPGRNAKRTGRPGEVPDVANISERDPDGRKLAKPKLSKRVKPGGDESPKADAAKTDAAKVEPSKTEPSKTEPAKDEPSKGEAAKDDQPKAAKDESNKPSSEGKSEAAKIDAPKETGSTPALRADPVPSVTPAPPASPAVAASAPQPAPVAPAGPPVPPISQ